MSELNLELLAELTEERGVPGHEERIRELVRRELSGIADEVRTDAMGNVVGTIEGRGDGAIAVLAHMDEIGFIVRHVRTDEEPFGFLEIDPLGGWDPRVMAAQRVTVHTEDGDLPGVVGSPPPHTADEDRGEPDLSDLAVDVGLPAAAVAERVSVGDLVSLDARTGRVGETVVGKALDDRVCLFAAIEAARRLEAPEATVHLCGTVQEEVGLRGASAVAAELDVDLGIALDVTVANDVPGFDAGERVTELGDGVAIKLKDSSVITSPRVSRRLRTVAEREGIAHQLEVLPSGGTDTGPLQRAGGPLAVGALSIPTRYLHTPTEVAHLEDVAAAIDLLEAVLAGGVDDYSP